MRERKKLFYLAKSKNQELTIEKIANTLNEKGIIEQKTFTKHMVSNFLEGKSNDEHIEKVLKELATESVEVPM